MSALIRTEAGELNIWEERPNRWAWATPNGSEGRNEDSFDAAVAEAFDAEGLKAADYGYPHESGEQTARAVEVNTHKRWDDPGLWGGVTTGVCANCYKPHVLRNGLCWTCEGDAK